jgi:hypothetical protein
MGYKVKLFLINRNKQKRGEITSPLRNKQYLKQLNRKACPRHDELSDA